MGKCYDMFTINIDDIDNKEYYGRMTPELLYKLLSLNSKGRTTIKGILAILNDDTIDHKLVIGEAKYRYIVKCGQNKLAKLLHINKSTVSRGLKELEREGLIIREEDTIYIHPFLLNKNKIQFCPVAPPSSMINLWNMKVCLFIFLTFVSN